MDDSVYKPEMSKEERIKTWYNMYPDLPDGARVAILSISQMETRREMATRPLATNPITGGYKCLLCRIGYDSPGIMGIVPERQLQIPEISAYISGQGSLDGADWRAQYVPGVGQYLKQKYWADQAHATHFFEVMLKKRVAAAMNLFSVGATMMHMMQSKIFKEWENTDQKARHPGDPSIPSHAVWRKEWPETWDELISMYLLDDNGLAWANRAVAYLGKNGFPGKDGPSNESAELNTCVSQTGNMQYAEKYYYGTDQYQGTGGVQASAIFVRSVLATLGERNGKAKLHSRSRSRVRRCCVQGGGCQ